MTWRTLGLVLSGTLFAAALAYWIAERTLTPALLVAASGILAIILTIQFLKRSRTSAPSSAAQTKKESNAPTDIDSQFSASVSNRSAATPATTAELESKPRCSLHFKEARIGLKKPDFTIAPTSGMVRRESYLAAMFANDAKEATELSSPAIHARAIYRNARRDDILKATNIPWAIGTGTAYTTLPANTSNFLVLFILTLENKLICRTMADIAIPIAGGNGKIPQPLDYELKEQIASVEIQLLSEAECLYRVALEFRHPQLNLLPQLEGFLEL